MKDYNLKGYVRRISPDLAEGKYLSAEGFEEIPDRIKYDPAFKEMMDKYQQLTNTFGEMIGKGLMEKVELDIKFTKVI